MEKLSLLDQYRKCAEVCSKTDYGNKATIRANNRAVDKMYKIVNEAVKQGPITINELSILLNEPQSASWLAHQLLEKATVNPDIEKKCLSIIWKLAMQDDDKPRQMGEKTWLRKWYKEKSPD